MNRYIAFVLLISLFSTKASAMNQEPNNSRTGIYRFPNGNSLQKFVSQYKRITLSALALSDVACSFAPLIVTQEPAIVVAAGLGLNFLVTFQAAKHLVADNAFWNLPNEEEERKMLARMQAIFEGQLSNSEE